MPVLAAKFWLKSFWFCCAASAVRTPFLIRMFRSESEFCAEALLAIRPPTKIAVASAVQDVDFGFIRLGCQCIAGELLVGRCYNERSKLLQSCDISRRPRGLPEAKITFIRG